MSALAALRVSFLTFSTGLVLIGVVAGILVSMGVLEGSLDTVTACIGVAVIGLLLQVASRIVDRDLLCGSVEELASSYKTRFFLRMAFAEAPALIGFVAVVLTGSAWPYIVGLAIASVGFARLAPTRSHLERDQEELTTRGCGHQLLHALQTATPNP